MQDLKLKTDAFLPLRDVVFNTLREAILRGDLKPGERLMELQLADKLGVSRTPIREAIRMLQQEGLAVTIPRRGAEVAAITEKDMEDALQIRQALEILAVQLASEKIDDSQIGELEEKVQKFEAALESEDIKCIAQADVDFHDFIYAAADNPKLLSMLNNLREQVYRYRVEYLKDKRNYPRLIEEHQQILDGFKRRDKAYVMEITKMHVDNQANAVKNRIRNKE